MRGRSRLRGSVPRPDGHRRHDAGVRARRAGCRACGRCARRRRIPRRDEEGTPRAAPRGPRARRRTRCGARRGLPRDAVDRGTILAREPARARAHGGVGRVAGSAHPPQARDAAGRSGAREAGVRGRRACGRRAGVDAVRGAAGAGGGRGAAAGQPVRWK